MLEAELCPPRVISPYRDESGDEELTVLPRHTKVIITGNNRTKSVLVGLQGVVRKAVGLGGWHWLVLKNGVEVKLQRNALSVLEPPTGNEVDDDEEPEFDISGSSSDMAEKDNDYLTSKLQFPKQSKLSYNDMDPWVSTAKSGARVTYKPRSKPYKPQPKVNLESLAASSLWRYCRCYNLVGPNTNTNPGYSKRQMIRVVQRHFLSQRMDEIQVVVGFIDAAKRLKTLSK